MQNIILDVAQSIMALGRRTPHMPKKCKQALRGDAINLLKNGE
jgi:hypothetical protein